MNDMVRNNKADDEASSAWMEQSSQAATRGANLLLSTERAKDDMKVIEE
jgi:hypothetical protein